MSSASFPGRVISAVGASSRPGSSMFLNMHVFACIGFLSKFC